MAKKPHHGGAWKVAYADFVTAMMALFMVMWICAQDKKILLATTRYFQSPFRSPLHDNSGVMPFDKATTQSSSSKSDDPAAASQSSEKDKHIELSFLNSVAADLYRLLHIDQDFADKPVDVQVTSDGLRITLFDRGSQPLFAGNTAEFTPWGKQVLQNLAWLVDRHKFYVVIDGHTRSDLTFKRADYGAWELSTDRANASRRILVYYAVDPGLIERVTGYADTRPLPGTAANSEANQRITLSLSLTAKGHDDPEGSGLSAPMAEALVPPTSSP